MGQKGGLDGGHASETAHFVVLSDGRRLRAYPAEYARMHEAFDVLISPVLAGPPPRIGEMSPEQGFDALFDRMMDYVAYTIFQNVGHAPAISLPLAQSEAGLPIGVQLGAANGQDRTLLELAYELEEAMPWAQRRAEV